MFNKLKQFKDIRKQAKDLQSTLSQASVTVEEQNCKISINGNMEVTRVEIDSMLLESDNKEKLEQILTKLYNKAQKKVQRIIAEKMRQRGGMEDLLKGFR